MIDGSSQSANAKNADAAIGNILNLEYEFDHVGIAVHSILEGEKVYKAMGFTGGHEEVVESEKVRVKMFELGNNSRIELLEPTSQDSAVAKFLEKRGPGIHHICLRVNDIRVALKKLKDSNIRLIHSEPFKGAHNCEVAFIHPSGAGGVLVELSQPAAVGHQGDKSKDATAKNKRGEKI